MNTKLISEWLREAREIEESLLEHSRESLESYEDQNGNDAYTNELIKIELKWNDRAAQVEAMTCEGWKPIESAPTFGTPVFISGFIKNDPSGERWVNQAVQCEEDGKWYESDEYENHSFYPPTHWMPLPAPPQDGLGEG